MEGPDGRESKPKRALFEAPFFHMLLSSKMKSKKETRERWKGRINFTDIVLVTPSWETRKELFEEVFALGLHCQELRGRSMASIICSDQRRKSTKVFILTAFGFLKKIS